MARESVEGQALELRWRDENETSLEVEDYLRMVLKKTCWYTAIYPCRVGALIGTRAPIAWDSFVRFGFLLGAAFQIQDDVLNLRGDHASYGKELGGDVREGKRTLALIHLLRTLDDDDRAQLKALLARPLGGRGEPDVAWVLSRMQRSGSIEFAQRTANELAGAAAFEFELAFAEAPPSRDRDFIEALPRWILERA
jgi:geranylgeranyl diphosphate synthase type II